MTGETVSELSPLDEAMSGYMSDLGIEGGALGLARNGEVIFERGYGWSDDTRTTAVLPDALFRIGSLSKSLTRATLYELETNDELSGPDRALDHLDIKPPAGEPHDERFADITVEQLIQHQGGLPGSHTEGDPVFLPRLVAHDLDIDSPPDSEDMVRYLLDQSLAYEPGTDTRYSNAGYVVLGHIIESVTGQSYQSYLETAVLPEPADVGLARTDPADREPREVDYHAPGTARTALDLDSEREVPYPDGGFLVELLGAAGGHYSSTRALLAFMNEYWIFFGEPRNVDVPKEPRALGSLPGSYAAAFHRDGVDVVALFNRRRSERSEEIFDRLHGALDNIES
jgi:CubicO group peptidase (beta-lactamase class C family)